MISTTRIRREVDVNQDEMVAVAHALGDARRFAVLCEIAAGGELSCGEVAERVGVSQPTASHHLRVLDEAGLIEVRHVAQRSLARAAGARLEAFLVGLRELLGPDDGLPDLGDGVID
jgi:DNA-binding transcriptional ArsR family regulator